MIIWRLFLLVLTVGIFSPAHAAAIHSLPNSFLGRWEENPTECKWSLEERDDHGWMFAKPKALVFFEGVEARILRLRQIGNDKYDVRVMVVEYEGKHAERYTLGLENGGQNLILEGKGSKTTYHKCNSRRSDHAPNQ